MLVAIPGEYRLRALDLVAKGESVSQFAKGLGVLEGTLRR